MISHFNNQHRFLSNFYPAPVTFDGLLYPSVEHAYQAAKTLDRSLRETVRQANTPAYAKKLGKRIPLRPDWNEVKLDIMLQLCRQKFEYPDLRQQLLETGQQELVEGNTWGDTFWGISRGSGHNHLGKILMQIRDEILSSG